MTPERTGPWPADPWPIPEAPEIDLAVLDRYLANECTDAERAQVERWRAEAPSFAQLLDRLTAGFDMRRRVSFTTGLAAVDRVAVAIAQRMHEAPYKTLYARPNVGSSGATWPMRIGVGAAALVAVVGAVSVLHHAGARQGPEAAGTAGHYASAIGRPVSVSLPDGSRLTLAPKSHARYAVDRNGTRTVSLQGQGYFVVTHDPRRPFAVRTGNVTTRVLGTTFDVRHYPTDTAVRVVVVDGKVASSGRGTPVLLSAGMRGEVTDSTAAVIQGDASRNETAWVNGRLVFTDAPVSAMLRVLERWYGYEFRLSDSTLAHQAVTAEFPTNDASKAMVALRALLHVTMTFDGSVVSLRPAPVSRAKKASFEQFQRPRRGPDALSLHEEVGR